MTTKIIAEYVWHDVIGCMRSKAKTFDKTTKTDISLSDFSEWNFDGSSTGQADGKTSDVVLRPVAFFKDPFRRSWLNVKCYLVLCETYNMDGTPHATNNRSKCMEVCNKTTEFEPWFGIEQEYFLCQLNKDQTDPDITALPLGWYGQYLPNYHFTKQTYPVSESRSSAHAYCGVGADRVFGREIVEQHFEHCLYAGIKICGINLEVVISQAEFQIGICSAHEIGDHLWMARYILSRVAEMNGAFVELHPKLMGDLPFNGSGGHCNFSTKEMRNENGLDKIIEACEKMKLLHAEHLAEYGDESNKLRLTGHHETASWEKFTYGFSDRGASIRIPYTTHHDKKGYLEDRRPPANCDPYKVVTRILKTVCLNVQ